MWFNIMNLEFLFTNMILAINTMAENIQMKLDFYINKCIKGVTE